MNVSAVRLFTTQQHKCSIVECTSYTSTSFVTGKYICLGEQKNCLLLHSWVTHIAVSEKRKQETMQGILGPFEKIQEYLKSISIVL